MSSDTDIVLTAEQKELLHALNPRQQKFVLNLVKGMNQTQAYKKAGYKPRNDKSARDNASRMIATDSIRSVYEALLKPRVEAEAAGAILTQEEALKILTNQARCSVDELVHMQDVDMQFDGKEVVQTIVKIKDSNELSDRAKASIKAITITQHGPKIELQCRQTAIRDISKQLGWDKASEKDKEQTNSLLAFVSGVTDAYQGNPAQIIGGRGDDE